MPAFSSYDQWKLKSPDDDRPEEEFEPELEEMTEDDWAEKQELEMPNLDTTPYAWAWTLFGNGSIYQRRLTFTKDDPFVNDVAMAPDRFTSVAVPLFVAADRSQTTTEPASLNAEMLAALVLVWDKVLTEYHSKDSYVRQQVEAVLAKADPAYAFLATIPASGQ